MTITTKQPTAILSPNSRVPMVDAKSGLMTTTTLQMLQQMFNMLNGLSLIVPCTAAFNSNLYTLTPFNIAPSVPQYYDYWTFAFIAPNASTGNVTATVVPATGTLPTLPVNKALTNATQAGNGDIFANVQYFLTVDNNSNVFWLR